MDERDEVRADMARLGFPASEAEMEALAVLYPGLRTMLDGMDEVLEGDEPSTQVFDPRR